MPIQLTGGFTILPEGTYVFKIVKVEYNEKFGNLTIHLETKDGGKHRESYRFVNDAGDVNTKAMNAFSYFARTAMNDMSLDTIEPEDLVGHFIQLTIVHRTSPKRDDPTKTSTFTNSTDKAPAEGWEDEEEEEEEEAAPAPKKDLRALLGGKK